MLGVLPIFKHHRWFCNYFCVVVMKTYVEAGEQDVFYLSVQLDLTPLQY